jgi:hypothetical protein
METRRFPPPWSAEDIGPAFVVVMALRGLTYSGGIDANFYRSQFL